MRNNQSFNQLRSVIRGMLSEMPLAGVMPVGKRKRMSPDKIKNSYVPSHIDPDEDNDAYMHLHGDEISDRRRLGHDDKPPVDSLTPARDRVTKDSMTKFHSSTKFLQDASRVFKSFPQKIYILPVMGSAPLPYDVRTVRSVIEDPEEGLELLADSTEDIDIDDIEQKLSQGATVIVSYVSMFLEDTLPTAWMILHAMLDADGAGGELGDMYETVKEMAVEVLFEGSQKSLETLVMCLTMKSARDRNLPTEGDVAAECIVQEVATSGGFRWKIDAETEEFALDNEVDIDFVRQTLEDIESYIKGSGVRQRFASALASSKGKLVFVSSVSLD